jgi:hypothetical protein
LRLASENVAYQRETQNIASLPRLPKILAAYGLLAFAQPAFGIFQGSEKLQLKLAGEEILPQ